MYAKLLFVALAVKMSYDDRIYGYTVDGQMYFIFKYKIIYMKVLGVTGGISYASTMAYYSLINKGVNEQLCGMELICANTVHVIADELEERIQLPLIQIARETAEVFNTANSNK